MKNKIGIILISSAMIGSLFASGTAFAADLGPDFINLNSAPRIMKIRPLISGTVNSVSGNIITITSKMGPGKNAADVIYTINTTNAQIIKNGSNSSTISDILAGDTITAEGKIGSTSVIATAVYDGVSQENILKRDVPQVNVPQVNEPQTNTPNVTASSNPSAPTYKGLFDNAKGLFSKIFSFF